MKSIDACSFFVPRIGMQQISESDLRFHIKYALMQVSKPTFKTAAQGASEGADAIAGIAERIVKSMEKWEILVPEPEQNIFTDLTAQQREAAGLKPER